MSSGDQSSSSTTNATEMHADNFHALKSLIIAVDTLTQDSSYIYASALLEDNTRLRKQINLQNEESARLSDKVKEVEAVKETAYKEMFDVNVKEQQRHVEAMEAVSSLKSAIHEKEEALAAQREEIEALNRQLQNSETSYKKEKETVVRANQDIDDLQAIVKTKDVHIEELKTAGSKIKRGFGELQKKHKDLEAAKSQTDEKMNNCLTRLNELEGYAATFCQDEEAVLYVFIYQESEPADCIPDWIIFFLSGNLLARHLSFM
jgi:chromosome segregation ATPase